MPQITPHFIKEVFDASNVVVSKEELELAFGKLANGITQAHIKDNPIAVCVMNGGLFITSEIVKRLRFPLQVDYIHASRYGNEYTGTSMLNWVKTPNIDPLGRTVILFDDILDGGLTLSEVKRYYEDRGAARVLTAVMLDKKAPREKGGLLKTDYCGTEVENEWVFGFGLDYYGYMRNVPEIRAVDKKHMI
ncbi:hypoxanthine-guanine phosphoribosyltransferase [Fastidiosibacter lacustris]|uniref:hypoxanthine-guanine phosphoribosyltransferase n=1 Tax=Fastidiosibacter lacustris TaxID=2056695 RepID=UPI000E344EF4|nr:hypoxanthine-guanine phosphoribosyltransferase [Fastidiosibacter lacustris]